jgi:DNA-binding NarL/FixJ family response regulator
MRILLADDQPKVRFALHVLLEQRPEVIVVGEAGDADVLMTILKSAQPDVLLLDWTLPGLSELGSISSLREYNSKLIIIALSGRPELGQATLEAGANAFVSKIDSPDRLIATITKCQNQFDKSQTEAKR